MSICHHLRIFLFFSLCLTRLSFAFEISEEKLIEVANSRYWHLLLHYKDNGNGSFVSYADGLDFFFDPQGKYDPLLELKASIKGMGRDIKVGKLKIHPQCVFRERYRFLKTTFHLNYEEKKCPEYQVWKEGISPQKLYIVFASAFPFNPASLFGHTFLLFRSSHQGKMLDYILNFSATVGNDSGIEFAFLGVTGFYEGHFSLMPYFFKINEYVGMEGRDLWEYPIEGASKEDLLRLIGHVWELENTTYFDYYFFDENCSFMLLQLMELLNPKWELLREFPAVVVPIDTIKALKKVGAINIQKNDEILYRPSLKNTIYHSEDNLDEKLKNDFLILLKGKVERMNKI